MVSLKAVLSVYTVFYSFSCLGATFIASPSSSIPREITLDGDLVLECLTDDEAQSLESAIWFKDGEKVMSTKTGRFKIETTPIKTSLRIKHFKKEDALIETWSVTTDAGSVCTFPTGSVQLVPSPQSISTDVAGEIITANETAIRRNLGETVRLECQLEPANEKKDQSGNIAWTFSRTESDFHEVLDHVVIDGDTLIIEKLSKRDRGNYRCSFNNYHFVILLRVKDKYGAMWPFLAVVVAVIIVVAISLFYERMNKAKKKAKGKMNSQLAQNEAADPLVKSTDVNEENGKKLSVQA